LRRREQARPARREEAPPPAGSDPGSLGGLEDLKPKHVVDLLERRETSGEGEGLGADGFGQALAARVALSPTAFLRLSDRLLALNPAYLPWLIKGLADRGRPLDWDAP
jgi:hypothetical protein